MERWSFVFVCSVFLNVVVNHVSGLTIQNCTDGWVDIQEDTSTFITCSNISKTENVTWTVMSIKNETILECVWGSIAVCNGLPIEDISLKNFNNDEVSLVINRNHRRYGGFFVTCSTTTGHAQCRMHVFHAAELSHCRTEINPRSWRVTATCHINKFFSSRDKARCEGRVESFMLEQSSKNYSRFNTSPLLQNYSDESNNNTYQKGTCSFTSDLPTSAGNYSYTINILPGTSLETAGKVLIVGPQSVSISTNATQPFVTDGKVQMELFCQADDVYPAVNYTWAGVNCINENHERGTCIFTPRVPQDDGHQVMCTAYNVVSLQQRTSEPYTIQLNYPPPSPPIITGYKEGSTLTQGESITLNCTVSGGKPKVTLVTFLCGYEPDCPDVLGDVFVTSSVVIAVQTKHNNTVCMCSATWIQHKLYHYNTSIRLFVSGLGSSPTNKIDSSSSPQDKLGQSVPTGIIAGVAVAVVVTVIVVAVIVYFTRRQHNQSTTRKTNFKDNTQHDDFQEEINEFYISADALALNRIHPVNDFPQSRVQDPVAQSSPHKSSDFTDKDCTKQTASNSSTSLSTHQLQTIQPWLNELEKTRECTMSNTENLYAVVADKDLRGSKP